ncbi:MAG: adenylate/guanylate cyclase protein [Frankiales bacterium]|nr:adenylate/guanylate cyclase protein [Frankiales bacterium]
MDSNYRTYDYITSFERIDAILALPQGNYEEQDSLPHRDTLTYTNGFYAYCSALFIDIRESSTLPSKYNRPALAKLYRAFISEMVAIFNSTTFAREINIVGDCVWGVYNTSLKSEVDEVFGLAARANSLMKTLNYKLKKAGYDTPVKAGIGISYGRALMIKAGSNGSGINDVVYMGDVVNAAAKLAAAGSNGYGVPALMIAGVFQHNLNDHNKGLLTRRADGTYQGNVINTAMDEWHTENCT